MCYASRMAKRTRITRNRWVVFYEAGAVVYDRIYGWYDAFELIPTDHPKREAEEDDLIARLLRAYNPTH